MAEVLVGRDRYIGRSGWSEVAATLATLAAGLVIASTPVALWDTTALRPFVYWQISNSLVSWVFCAAATTSIIGVVHGWRNGATRLSRWTRTVGMSVQIILWFWLVRMSLYIEGIGAVATVAYGYIVLSCFRVLVLIWVDPVAK